MINFKNQDDVVPSTLILLSILIMAATLIYMVAVPAPSATGIKKTSQHVYMKQITDAKAASHTARAAIAPRIWSGDADTVSASVLALLTDQASKSAIKLGAFRPQRATPLSGITEFPYIVQVSGSYTGVRNVMKALDAPDSKVVLRSVQVSSSEDAGAEVTVTLGLSAYVPSDPLLLPNGGAHG